MFKVWFTNFGYASERRFATVEDALAFAKSTSFECQIVDKDENTVGSYSYFGGWRPRRA